MSYNEMSKEKNSLKQRMYSTTPRNKLDSSGFNSKPANTSPESTENKCTDGNRHNETPPQMIEMKKYERALLYINECHAFMNQMCARANSIKLPEVPNFISMYTACNAGSIRPQQTAGDGKEIPLEPLELTRRDSEEDDLNIRISQTQCTLINDSPRDIDSVDMNLYGNLDYSTTSPRSEEPEHFLERCNAQNYENDHHEQGKQVTQKRSGDLQGRMCPNGNEFNVYDLLDMVARREYELRKGASTEEHQHNREHHITGSGTKLRHLIKDSNVVELTKCNKSAQINEEFRKLSKQEIRQQEQECQYEEQDVPREQIQSPTCRILPKLNYHSTSNEHCNKSNYQNNPNTNPKNPAENVLRHDVIERREPRREIPPKIQKGMPSVAASPANMVIPRHREKYVVAGERKQCRKATSAESHNHEETMERYLYFNLRSEQQCTRTQSQSDLEDTYVNVHEENIKKTRTPNRTVQRSFKPVESMYIPPPLEYGRKMVPKTELLPSEHPKFRQQRQRPPPPPPDQEKQPKPSGGNDEGIQPPQKPSRASYERRPPPRDLSSDNSSDQEYH